MGKAPEYGEGMSHEDAWGPGGPGKGLDGGCAHLIFKVFIFFIVVNYIQHKIYHFNLFLSVFLVALSTFMVLCNHHR